MMYSDNMPRRTFRNALVASTLVVLALASVNIALAADPLNLKDGITGTDGVGQKIVGDTGGGDATYCNKGLVCSDAATLIIKVINWLLSLIALIALAAIIWGGISYIISLGDESKTAAAKRIVLYAVVGLLVAGVSFVVIQTIKTILTT